MSRAENGIELLVFAMILAIAVHAVVFTVRSDAPIATSVVACPDC